MPQTSCYSDESRIDIRSLNTTTQIGAAYPTRLDSYSANCPVGGAHECGEQFLLAGLEREVGPSGDVKAAYQRWYAERMEEHDRAMRICWKSSVAAEALMPASNFN